MANNFSTAVQQPVIAKYAQPFHNGIQSYNLSRHGIGMVLRGKKYIYSGDVRQEIGRGDLFFLATGNHYIEDQPEANRPFEQIMFYYTPSQLASILSQLSITYHLNISNDHSCTACREQNFVVCEATSALRNFFLTTNNYIKDELFNHDETAENLKMTELIYLIVSQEDNCIKSKVMDNADTGKESFEQIIYAHIFEDVPIEELARMCNRSLVHQAATDARATAAHLDQQIDLGGGFGVRFPQHLALHQTLQKGLRTYARQLSSPPRRRHRGGCQDGQLQHGRQQHGRCDRRR